MGRRGPPPTPSPILRLRGTLRSDRVRNEPQPPSGRPVCPAWLDAEAKSAWRQLIPLLEETGVLTKLDRNAITRYCQLWSRWKKAEQFLQKQGDVYPLKDEQGRIRCLQQFPQVGIANKLAQALHRLEQEFGMTPSARTRIQVEDQQTRSTPLEEAKNRFFA